MHILTHGAFQTLIATFLACCIWSGAHFFSLLSKIFSDVVTLVWSVILNTMASLGGIRLIIHLEKKFHRVDHSWLYDEKLYRRSQDSYLSAI